MTPIDADCVLLGRTILILDENNEMVMATTTTNVVELFRLKQRTIASLEWMTTQLCWQFDNEKDAMCDEGSQDGGYSPELTEAIDLLEELKK